ncbi:hypothetical protein F5B22DRAFT_593581 [Xylaria bambusicola]|uniref:uncharacterized protein n=1 Tax=Xylaria bambusicola TaxID=326684 RepID=UPI002007DFBD|nr:uncharacterized protein F5B22DRAFT_593581 [Xylaria bambusicola]KAI0522261.1 hypothetical protein F5B22DRAFT_593581 [Xylaria bambusicola]
MKRTISRLASLRPLDARVQAQPSPVHFNGLAAWDDPNVQVKPGQHVIAICNQYDISFPTELRPLGTRLTSNPYKITVVASPKHCFFHQSMKYFDRLEHPFAKSLLDIYIQKKKEPLWMSAFAHGGSPFANGTAKRKLMHAVRDALLAAGYDRFGQSVPVDGESSAVNGLYGSLRLMSPCPQAICTAKFADLLDCAKQIIFAAEIKLRGNKSNPHLESGQQHSPLSRGTFGGRPRAPNNKRKRTAN